MHNSVSNLQAWPSAPAVVSFRRFRVEYDADGAPFVWVGDAISEAAAIRCAAHDLAVRCPNFTGDIRATVVIEVDA